MKRKYERVSLTVEAEKYELGKGLEDGFESFTKIVTEGWITTEDLVKIKQSEHHIVCPYIRNRRGLVFIREGDYIIYEEDGERHCCGEDKFFERFRDMKQTD